MQGGFLVMDFSLLHPFLLQLPLVSILWNQSPDTKIYHRNGMCVPFLIVLSLHRKIVSIVFRKFSFILNRLNCNVPVKPLHVKGACTELALDAAREHRYHQAGGK